MRLFHSKDNIIISFAGMSPRTRFRGLMTIIRTLLQRSDSKDLTFAVQAVKSVQMKYPDKQVILTGHSLGGLFSTWCGITLRLPAVNFNSMGLSHKQISTLQHSGASQASIIQLNGKNDWLSSVVQRPFLTQPGVRFTMENFSGHGLGYQENGRPHFLVDDVHDTYQRLK